MLETLRSGWRGWAGIASLRPGRDAWKSYAVATLLVVCVTSVGFVWVEMPDPRNLSLLFFGAILLSGVLLGMRPALYAAVLAFLSTNFFLVEPRFVLKFALADYLALVTFVAGALLVGGFAERLNERARDATNRLRDLTALFEAGRDLSGAIEPDEAAERVVHYLGCAGCSAAIWIETPEGSRLAAAAAPAREAAARMDALRAENLSAGWTDEKAGKPVIFRLRTGERLLGQAAIWTPTGTARPDLRWVETLLELGAVAIDRAHLIAEVAEAKVIAEKEGLRTALLSSLSHDLRTPIATIFASATSLQEHEGHFDESTRREMLETIQEESERLNRYVSNLLDMTRLESGALQLRSALMDPGEAVASALERVERRLRGRRLMRSFNTQGKLIDVDPVLMEQALVNVLENAMTYAPPGSTIFVRTELSDGRVKITVEDEGPGIPAIDLGRVFDKFFRGRSDRRPASGVGLGLSVTRGLIEAFLGSVRAISPAVGNRGARFEILLPAHPALETVE
jgi:two-component system sensor histidine kinase KdpD